MSARRRLLSLAWFVIAVVYYTVARGIASVAANGLASGHWFDFAYQAILLFLFIVGFAAMGYAGQKQFHPVIAMGLGFRPGGRREFALGAAIGWTGVAVCALIIAVSGAMVVFFYTGWLQFALIPLDLAILLIASLAEEVAFRGYPFQRLSDATNPFFAMLVLSGLYALAHITNPGASPASFLVTMFAGWLLTIAYLRTRALWMGWGIHFAWNASMAVLFGLPLSGTTRFSPVITSTAIGSTWLTGFNYGPEGSAVGIVVMLALIPLTFWATRGFSVQRSTVSVPEDRGQGPRARGQEDSEPAGEREPGPIITPPPDSLSDVQQPVPEQQSGNDENPLPQPQPEEQSPPEPVKKSEPPKAEPQSSRGNGE
ncbi:MAG TPA: CPBP family glutamic-type intramembrane protease [Acidobacteriaceae bacterium]|nr:CPBP family glutamic-type intramembrane protease [Acidobacteriaceae bacterium]